MIRFNAVIKKFDKQGEKTRWTYIEIPARHANKLNPGVKTSFRIKGKLDDLVIQKLALIPMGAGSFILPLNAKIRKSIMKKMGDKLKVEVDLDSRQIKPSPEFLKCMKQDPEAYTFFKSLSGSHQRYFSKWIDGAKTQATQTKRIVMALTAFSKKQGFPEMMRANKESRYD